LLPRGAGLRVRRVHAETSTKARAWLQPVLAMLPLLLGLACLALFDASEQTEPPQVRVSAGAQPQTRLVVLMVDSLDRRDVESARSLPALHGRLASAGLSGPVRACVDAVTIPCVSAMITGFDRASSFSPLRNFGAARELAQESVLGALEQHGHRVGYFGDTLLARALSGLTVVRAHEEIDDDQTVHDALASLAADHLELVFIHLLALDEAAHKFTAQSAEYTEALHRTDARIARAMAALRADDHVVVLGDHGHAETGRHSAGMGTETYAAYFGPRFQGSPRRALAMTDHARLWARLFGLSWGERTWVEGYFEQTRGAASVPRTHGTAALAVRPRAPGPLLMVLVVCLLLAATGSGQALHRRASWSRARVLALLVGLTVTLGLSVLVTWLWPVLGSDLGALTLSVFIGLLGALVLRLWTAAPRAQPVRFAAQLGARGVTGALLWALPTAEPTAGIKAPMLWLEALLLHRLVPALRGGARLRVVSLLSCLLALLLLTLVRVRDYLPRLLFVDGVGNFVGVLLPVLLLLAAVLSACGARAALLTLLGSVIAMFVGDSHSRWLLLPCALLLPLALVAFRSQLLVSLACLLLPLAGAAFFAHDSPQLMCIATTLLLWALLPALLREETVLVRASSFLLLMWLSFWTTMSTRIGGIDYDFYFRFLPHDAAATSEAVQQGLLTAAKCMLPPVFGALLAQRAGGLPLAVLKCAEQLTRLRMAVTLLFLLGLSLGRGAADLQLLYDATQEAAFWLLMFAVLGLIAAANQVGLAQPARDEAAARTPLATDERQRA
jgi:hypothetical protein